MARPRARLIEALGNRDRPKHQLCLNALWPPLSTWLRSNDTVTWWGFECEQVNASVQTFPRGLNRLHDDWLTIAILCEQQAPDVGTIEETGLELWYPAEQVRGMLASLSEWNPAERIGFSIVRPASAGVERFLADVHESRVFAATRDQQAAYGRLFSSGAPDIELGGSRR